MNEFSSLNKGENKINQVRLQRNDNDVDSNLFLKIFEQSKQNILKIVVALKNE